MRLSSVAFNHNQPLPAKYTCDGLDVNPPLFFLEIPEETASLVLTLTDPDAPGKTFIHWVVFNIDPSLIVIDEDSVPEDALTGANDFGRNEYGGPCPHSGTHRYVFTLYALDDNLDLPEGASFDEVREEMQAKIIDKTELIGTYRKK
jgi:hypothetical protein